MSDRHGKRDARPPTEPAPTLTEKARSDEWEYVNGNQANAARRRERESQHRPSTSDQL